MSVYAARVQDAMAGAVDTQKLAEAWQALHPKDVTKAAVPAPDQSGCQLPGTNRNGNGQTGSVTSPQAGHRHTVTQTADAGQATKAVSPVLGAFLGRASQAIQGALRGVLERLWTEAWVLGNRSALAAAGRLDPDWGSWTPGDYAAAEQIAGPGLRQLLDEAGIRIKSIADSRLEELSQVLEDTLRSDEITRQPTGPLPPFLSVGDLAQRLKAVLDNPDRAGLVAQAEIARAQATAARQVYAETGRTEVEVSTAEDDKVCPVCEAAEKLGAHPLGAPPLVPLHPRCRCAELPVLGSSTAPRAGLLPPAPPATALPGQAPVTGDSPAARILGDLLTSDGSSVADGHLRDLAAIPPGFLQQLRRHGTRVILTSKSVGGSDPALAGVQPRGWPQGMTWDSVPGVYAGPDNRVILGNDAAHGASSLALHETSHAIDAALGRPSQSPEFAGLYRDVAAALGERMSPYYRQAYQGASLEEFFGEALAVWMRCKRMPPGDREAQILRALAGGTPPAMTGRLGDALADLDAYFGDLLAGAEAR